MGVGRLRIWGTGTCSADLKGEVNQGPIFLDKCRYALLNERVVKYRLSEHFFFLTETRGELKYGFKGEVSHSVSSIIFSVKL